MRSGSGGPTGFLVPAAATLSRAEAEPVSVTTTVYSLPEPPLRQTSPAFAVATVRTSPRVRLSPLVPHAADAGETTVTSAVSAAWRAVAMIIAVPGATPCTVPVLDTVATAVFVLCQAMMGVTGPR